MIILNSFGGSFSLCRHYWGDPVNNAEVKSSTTHLNHYL